MKHRLKLMFGLALPFLAISKPSQAATATGSFQVSLTIQSNCMVQSASNLSFGTTGVISSSISTTNTIGVQCTNTTPYTVGLSAGTGTGATVATRQMTSAANATVAYSVYHDSAHTQVWGVTAGTDTAAGTGNGAVQSYTAYGNIAAQTTPAAGSYTDLLSVTVTY